MIPRNEYPRPQLVRKQWMCLNGEWDFFIDNGKKYADENPFSDDLFTDRIIVPFCPESRLSGIADIDFMDAVCYRRSFILPKSYIGKRLLLHFGAVDYYAKVFVNGIKVGEHKGGYTSFCFDITAAVNDGENVIVVYAEDDVKSPLQSSGKQSPEYESFGCFYTRTTGIWQTVWIEPVNETYIKNFNYICDIENVPLVTFTVKLDGECIGKTLKAKITYQGRAVGDVSKKCTSNTVVFTAALFEKHLWEVGKGRLYDVEFSLTEGHKTTDKVSAYFGLREVGLTRKAFTLNGKIVFGRWVLDQGFYPDGIYTAPTDEDLKKDILYSMRLGFNGARLHQKVFEPRFLYWADKLGYLVWGEYPNWGLSLGSGDATLSMLPEWLESVERDASHPSIIGWCPFNETNPPKDENVRAVYLATKAVDPGRPVIDASGWQHIETDIFDIHDYTQDTEAFAENFNNMDNFLLQYWGPGADQVYGGQPVFVSEYGGIQWSNGDGWGYGEAPESEEEFLDRYRKLTETLLFNKDILGFCYTQLYDIEQEQNGLMTYDRKFKFDPEIIRKINSQKAAIEK